MGEPLVSDFRAYLGAERYREFLLQLNGHLWPDRELHWWMNREWRDFIAERAEYRDCDPRHEFQLCYIHGRRLQPETLRMVYGTFREDPRRLTEYPYGKDYLGGVCWGGEAKEGEALVCMDCRARYLRIHKRHVPRAQSGDEFR